MSFVVLLRGANVGGHRTFRPSLVAGALGRFGVVNVGAAGTFVVRGAVGQREFRAALSRRLPFSTEIMIVGGADVLALVAADPFAGHPSDRMVVPFVSVLARHRPPSAPLPQRYPAGDDWGVAILGQRRRFVLGVYRRNMKAIGHLGQVDKLFGVPATTRNWNTMVRIANAIGRPGA